MEDAEIVLIEPVGCLADLASTVLAPLRRDAGEAVMLAPLSVLVDPRHAEALLDHASGARDGESLRYLVRRQLEEADLILLTQIDRLEPGRAEALRARLAAKFPEACVLAISARNGSGLREWLALLESGPIRTAPAAAIDGERYAQAVAQLGWLDATIEFVLPKTASGSALLQSVGGHLQVALEGSKLLHLKVALSTEDAAEAGLLGLVPQDDAPELIRRCDAALETGEFIVNVRAETHPEKLHTAVRAAIVELTREFHGLQTEFAHLHYFRPPKPTLATPA